MTFSSTPEPASSRFRRGFFLGLFACLLMLGSTGCVPPQSPIERLSFAAHDLNAACRFGRLDIALMHVGREAQARFLDRRAKWGEGIRIVDVELMGIRVTGDDEAQVRVKVSWHRLDETTIRTSRIEQTWSQGINAWSLTEEQRIAGSPGIFTPPPKPQKTEKADAEAAKPSDG